MRPHEVRSIGTRVQERVRAQFGWPLASDQESAISLLASVENYSSTISIWNANEREQTIVDLQEKLFQNKIAAVGAAVTASEIHSALESNHHFIFADGSLGIIEELDEIKSEEVWSRTLALVTDADGHPYISKAVERDIPHILHAHGDNQEEWEKMLVDLSNSDNPPRLILTHQTPDRIDGMMNPGGFTDGDRTICLIGFLGVPISEITLLGYRSDIVGQWSGATDPERKLRKLIFMQEVIDGLLQGASHE
tara:strand:+ start:431 stop:1183 length:753 start_codon:yes stop_codon:yes gene_type:complete